MNVVIVGAGVAGLSIGWRLRQAGAKVTVLERAQPAQAATWAAAGMIAAAGEMGAAQTPMAEFGHRSASLWPGFASEIEAASGQQIGYRQSGALFVARTAADLAGFKNWTGVEHLDRATARAREPLLATDIAGALWAPDEAQVDTRALGAALATAFVRAGGILSVNEAAIRFEVRDNRSIALYTPFRRYEADAFIVAAGAWSGSFGGVPEGALPTIRPVKGELIAIQPKSPKALPRQVVWGNNVYLVPRGDRLIIGATMTEAGFDTSVSTEAANWLSSRAIGLVPSLTTWEVVERWAGLRPAAPDGVPVLGRTKVEGLFVASGQFRNGILFAPAVATAVSQMVLGGGVEIAAFDPRRF
ncbi:MAG: glycine oxidase ThiO [Alphaproteobacteria bacterium]|nr:glycine oxidase ThiO [Alphaproteobacteria bacterium]MBL7096628.1 glycine oxidase ThiO [Alphaproteobacteria bacterium]